MPLAGIVTIIGAAVIILALAAYLIRVALLLWRVDKGLGSITDNLLVVGQKTEPVGTILSEINRDLDVVDDALHAAESAEASPSAASSATPPRTGWSNPPRATPRHRAQPT